MSRTDPQARSASARPRRPLFTLVTGAIALALLVYTYASGGFDGVTRLDRVESNGLDRAGDGARAADVELARDPFTDAQLAPAPAEDAEDAASAPSGAADEQPRAAADRAAPAGDALTGLADVEALRRSDRHLRNAADAVEALELSQHLTDGLADAIEDWTCAHAAAHFAAPDDQRSLRREADRRRDADVRALFAQPSDAAPVLAWIDGHVRIPQRR